MAEAEVNMEQENKLADKEEEEDTNEETNLDRNTCVLAGLNLVLILSSLSLSDEERLDFEEIDERESGNCNHKAKQCGSRSNIPTRRQQVNGFRAVERQMSKVQTRDCRHCRRL
ncbi:hypothetical protein Pfo_005913 [Paulownia fortunei]|nr:hypothetical protein Pfo_005913 [Paulownia fortunei]